MTPSKLQLPDGWLVVTLARGVVWHLLMLNCAEHSLPYVSMYCLCADDPDLKHWQKLPGSFLPHPPADMDLTGVCRPPGLHADLHALGL